MADYEEIRAGRRRDWWRKRREAAKAAQAAKNVTPLEQMQDLIRNADDPWVVRRPAPDKSAQEELAEDRPESEPPPDIGLPGPPPDPSLLESPADRVRAQAAAEDKAAKAHRVSRTREEQWEAERERDRAEFRKHKLQALIVGGIFIAAILGWLGSNLLVHAMTSRADYRDLNNAMKRVDAGEYVYDLSTPGLALASYRVAWIRGDMKTLLDMSAPQARKAVLSGQKEQDYLKNQFRLYFQGRYKAWVDAMAALRNPMYVRRAGRPWHEGHLAVFRVPTRVSQEGDSESTAQYLAFTYRGGRWKYAKSVHESAWKPYWTTDEQLFPEKQKSARRARSASSDD